MAALDRAFGLVEAGLRQFSVDLLPWLVAVASIAALVFWDPIYPTSGGSVLGFRVVEDRQSTFSAEKAREYLENQPAVVHRETQLSEAPFWLLSSVVPAAANAATVVEFTSRHATDLACWDARSLAGLGSASRSQPAPADSAVALGPRAGFSVNLGILQTPGQLLCRARHVGPARIAALGWDAPALASAANQHVRHAGLLDGGILMLAGFVLVTALINRERLYVLFAVWLVANLRMASISAGWDTQWLGTAVPSQWLPTTRTAAVAAYFALTALLFLTLFKAELERLGTAALRRLIVALCAVVLLATSLPYSSFLQVTWACAAPGIFLLVYLLVRIIVVARSRVAVWYAASLGVTLFASLYEVVAASLGIRALIGSINSVTAALFSSLIAAIAIAEQMRQERDGRRQAEAELARSYDASPIGLFTLSEDGDFLRVNKSLRAMLEMGARSSHWNDYFEHGSWSRLRQMVESDALEELELRGVKRTGERWHWYLAKATLVGDCIEGSLQDITERVEALDRLRYLSEHDTLTELWNRRGIEHVLRDVGDAMSVIKCASVAYLELDRFQLINDLFGHDAGDEVLKQVCRRITECLSDDHHVARIGGDEFVILLPGVPVAKARTLCQSIANAVSASPFRIAERAFSVRCSIGLVEVSDPARVRDAIALADRACTEAKAAKTGTVVFEHYSTALAERAAELRLVERFADGSAFDRLFLVMQPIMSIASPAESLDFEVLVRMRSEDGGVVSGGSVVAAAESSGRISDLDRWVLRQTLNWLERNSMGLQRTRFASVNISAGSLNDERFVQDAIGLVRAYRAGSTRFCVEITESAALHDLANTRRCLSALRDLGVKVALDDFGAAYTSFAYLKELPSEAIKIDASLIQGINAHPANAAIVEGIVQIARSLGMRSIALGVEDGETIATLSQIGIDYVQGHAISAARAPDEILAGSSSSGYVADEQMRAMLQRIAEEKRAEAIWSSATLKSGRDIH